MFIKELLHFAFALYGNILVFIVNFIYKHGSFLETFIPTVIKYSIKSFGISILAYHNIYRKKSTSIKTFATEQLVFTELSYYLPKVIKIHFPYYYFIHINMFRRSVGNNLKIHNDFCLLIFNCFAKIFVWTKSLRMSPS